MARTTKAVKPKALPTEPPDDITRWVKIINKVVSIFGSLIRAWR